MDGEKQRETANDTDNHLLTIGQVAELLGKPPSTIRSWLAVGVFIEPAKRQRGMKSQWRRGDVVEWAKGRGAGNG